MSTIKLSVYDSESGIVSRVEQELDLGPQLEFVGRAILDAAVAVMLALSYHPNNIHDLVVDWAEAYRPDEC